MNNQMGNLKAALNLIEGTNMSPLLENELLQLQNHLPELTFEYLDFMRSIGWGPIGHSRFMIYSGPIEPESIFDAAAAEELAGILLIGDDFAGWSVGFDTRQNWKLIGIDSSDTKEIESLGVSLVDFQTRKFAPRT